MKYQSHRRKIVDLCLQLSHRGFFAGTGGNIASRIDAELIAVTPSATDYLEMTAAQVCVLRLADLKQVEGERAPSVESGLHARVLRARSDVECSIHTHQPVASACALLGADVPVPQPLQPRLGKVVPIVGYAPSGTSWLAALLGRAVRPDINGYLMLNHGALCCGPEADAAMQAVEDLETLTRDHLQQLIALRLSRKPWLELALQRVQDAMAH
jgi:L-fuculose-phosphate aldolase